MPTSSKPRKKYKPKPMMLNAHEWAMESAKPLTKHDTYVVDWSMRNHSAFEALLQARATRKELNTVVSAHNICDAIIRKKYKADDDEVGTLTRSKAALLDICDRAAEGKGTAMRAPEIQAMRDLLGLHDTLLANVTVREFEIALAFAKKELAEGRADVLKGV